MVAAALTIWLMFALWMLARHLGLSRVVARIAAALLVAELVLLLSWSYATENCRDPRECPWGEALGVASRVDVPALTAAFLAFVTIRAARRRPSTTLKRTWYG